VQALRNLYKNSDFIQNSAKLITGTTISQVILFLISPILTRIYSAQDFGDLAIINSSIGVLVIIGTLRYEMGIVIADDDSEAIGLAKQINKTLVAWTILLALGFTGLKLTETISSPWWYLLIPVGIYFQGIQYGYNYLFNRRKLYSELSFSKIFQVASNGLWALSLGFLTNLKVGLLAAPIIGFFTSCLYLFSKNKGHQQDYEKRPVFKKYIEFPKYNMPSALIGTLSQHVPVYALSYLYSSELTGHYSLAMKVLLLPMTLISTAVSQVFFQKFSELFKSRSPDTLKFLFKVWKSLFLIGLIPITILFFFGEPLFEFVFGKEWIYAGEIVSTLSPMLLFMFVSSPTSTGYITIKKQAYTLFFNIFGVAYRAGALYYGFTQNDALIGFKILAYCEILQIILFNVLLTILVKQDLKKDLKAS
jgi:lipopolysaccharide exporter